jgi:rod shape-determining protein MreC
MSTNSQPFFVRGPSPLARLTIFGLAALVLMFIDSRFRTLDSVRSVIATVVHPMQALAMTPLNAWRAGASWLESRNAVQNENDALKQRALNEAQAVQGYKALEEENARLRALLSLRTQAKLKGVAAQIMSAGRDPFSQHTFIDRGAQHGIKAGQAAIDSSGVVGQVTRVHPLVAELTLVTEKDLAIPVRNDRTGVRLVMFGRGAEQSPELRYVQPSVDVQVGDLLTTSGVDGLYPPSLAVAKVSSVSRDPGQLFLRVQCQPLASLQASGQVLVLETPPPPPEIPKAEPEPEKGKGKAGAKKSAEKASDKAAEKATEKATEKAPAKAAEPAKEKASEK